MNHREVLEKIYRLSETQMSALRAAIELMRASESEDEAAERERCAAWSRGLEVETNLPESLYQKRAQARAEVEAKYAALLAPKNEAAQMKAIRHLAIAASECNPTMAVLNLNDARYLCNQARAEGYASRGGDMAERLTSVTRANEQLLAQLADTKSMLDSSRMCADIVIAERDLAAAKLAASQAEIERLQNQVADLAEHDSAGARAYDKLETKLTTAQAEIERLKTLCNKLVCGKLQAVERCNAADDAETAAVTKLANLRTAAERFESWYSSEEFDSLDTKRVAEFCAAIEASR